MYLRIHSVKLIIQAFLFNFAFQQTKTENVLFLFIFWLSRVIILEDGYA